MHCDVGNSFCFVQLYELITEFRFLFKKPLWRIDASLEKHQLVRANIQKVFSYFFLPSLTSLDVFVTFLFQKRDIGPDFCVHLLNFSIGEVEIGNELSNFFFKVLKIEIAESIFAVFFATRAEIENAFLLVRRERTLAVGATRKASARQVEFLCVVNAYFLLFQHHLHFLKKLVGNNANVTIAWDVVSFVIKYLTSQKAICEHSADIVFSKWARCFWYFLNFIFFSKHLLLRPPAAHRDRHESLLFGISRKVRETPVACGVVFKNLPDDGGSNRVNRFLLHFPFVQIADGSAIGADTFLARSPYRQRHFLTCHTRVVLCEHSVNIFVQFSRTSLIVFCPHETEIDTLTHQLSDEHIIALVSANTVPTQADNALEKSAIDELYHLHKLRSVHAILDQSAFAESNLIVFSEP